MFTVDGYKIEFKRLWHHPSYRKDFNGPKSGRYDTKCKITTKTGAPDHFGLAKLHPKDRPDKVVGKKVALQKALDNMYSYRGCEVQHIRKVERTAIWKAFFAWVESWKQ